MRYLVEDGQHIKAQEPYAEVEVMKMITSLVAPEAGRIHFLKNTVCFIHDTVIVPHVTIGGCS